MWPTLTLAGPVVTAELGWVAMGVVDTMIVSRLGAEAVGAVGLGSMVFITVAVFGMGLLLGLDTLVARAYGADDLDGCHRALFQGLYLAVGFTPLLALAVFCTSPMLAILGINPAVLREAGPYLRATAWGVGPLLIFAALRRYLQATSRVGAVTFALVSANLVNAVGNWMLIYGRLGAPAMGVEGSGWATTLARLYLALVLIGYIVWDDRRNPAGLTQASWQPDPIRLRYLLALGFPAALHVTLETGVFALATALAARLDAVSLAAHQVVLNVSSVTFMIPFGLASAGAVRVGHALGRGDPSAAARAGWATLGLAVAFMTASSVTFGFFPEAILGAFTDDPRVLSLGVTLMLLAAFFQPFDGLQGVTTGNLRGTGDTHTPMTTNLIAYWCLGLPLGYALAFPSGMGVVGLWLGLSLGIVVSGSFLLHAWIVKTRALTLATDHPECVISRLADTARRPGPAVGLHPGDPTNSSAEERSRNRRTPQPATIRQKPG
jgi:MATE family multidrug resistance protein